LETIKVEQQDARGVSAEWRIQDLKEGGIDFVFLLFSLLLPSYFVPPLFIHGRIF
jgi:hypothetical protein